MLRLRPRELLREQRSIAAIAEFLCRDLEEVEAKIAERRGQSAL
jgi:hypothetical protein